MAVGGSMEKIVSAFHSVLKEHFNEDSEVSKCKATIRRVEKMVEVVNVACGQGRFFLLLIHLDIIILGL